MGPSEPEGIALNSKKILYHDFLNDIFFFYTDFEEGGGTAYCSLHFYLVTRLIFATHTYEY